VAFGAGGFATVPPLMACRLAWVPIAIHQQDVLPGLANRMLRPFAALSTVALPETRQWKRWHAAPVVGNPVRPEMLAGDAERARQTFGLRPDLPTILVTGGGTGALRLNELTAAAAPSLLDSCQIIHLTGTGKQVPGPFHPSYRQIEFLIDEMADALAAADVVVSRAGMSSLTEIGALAKAAIIIPMPASHQELNAAAVARHGAGIVLNENTLTPDILADTLRSLTADPARRRSLGQAAATLLPSNAADTIAQRLTVLAQLPAPHRG
jgi:UDP-N-acetylglucosamine--N-acetylmuramyl-(pentapeptide) pyrophosphoryl-undecaprenol N-acetylglucosamine transferase